MCLHYIKPFIEDITGKIEMKTVFWVAVLCLVLVSCIQIVEEEASKEVVYTPEVVKANKTSENVTVNVTIEHPTNISVSNMTNATNTTNQFGTDAEWLSIGAQHKLVPEMEELVKASECYQVTFENASQYVGQNGLEIVKEIRFDYLGGKAFKGWILNKLVKRFDVFASENFEVLVDDREVICLDDPVPIPIDWQKVLSKLH